MQALGRGEEFANATLGFGVSARLHFAADDGGTIELGRDGEGMKENRRSDHANNHPRQ